MSHTLNLTSRSPGPDTQILTRVIVGLIAPGFGLTVVLLALFKYVAWNPVSRRYVDRVSFRLLTYALIAHLVFCVTFPVSSLNVHPGWQCDLLAFGMNLSLMFSAGMFFCIALNLPLVLALRINGQKMEKYYVLGIAFTCLIVNLASYASGSLGWDAVNETCWYSITDPEARLRWLIGTQTFWIVLFAVGEVVAFLVIVGYVVSYMLETRCSHADSQPRATDSSQASHRPGLRILMFRNIILRVALYPIVSCVLNISTAVIDLYESRNYARKHLMSTELRWRLNLADLTIYAGRPLIYGLLAVTDPSFIRALRALRHPEDESTTQPRDLGRSAPCLSTVIDIPPDTYCEADDLMRETSTIPTLDKTLEEGNERRLDVGPDQSGMMMNAPAPTQRPSIDVVCHI
ncbi:hypothetical protein DFH08DRAFT_357041 [Mycena albidolilacea]|uniref:Uncharacterized protein n=1 Tax=Mycena albidolilacea TaxID=1033008 RepID=A0AAD7EGT1_9AGAR|nr:hypothetical protein DFH08DRAFT_357041 [Mycena albidolilacea]